MILAVGSAIGAQAPGAELPARQLENGDRLAREGRVDQALAAWKDVATSWPDSREAPLALDRFATALYPGDGTDPPTGAPRSRAEFDQARTAWSRIASDYRASTVAPRSLLRLGAMLSDPAVPFRNLDEAYARFAAVTALYPDSDAAATAMLGQAQVLRRQGQSRLALGPLTRLAVLRPQHAVGDRAANLMGLSLASLGHYEAAARVFQDLRTRAPGSPLAALAAARNEHLVRLLLAAQPGAIYGRPSIVTPRLPEGEQLREVKALSSNPAGELAVADARGGLVYVFDTAGVLRRRFPSAATESIAWGPSGWVMAAAEGVVLEGRSVPLRLPAGREPLKPRFAAVDLEGRTILLDDRSGDLLRFQPDGAFESVLGGGRENRYLAATIGVDGAAYALETRSPSIQVWRADGSRARLALDAALIRRPEALAVDFAGNLFLIDGATRTVVMLSPTGTRLKRIGEGEGRAVILQDPTALTVTESGHVVCWDRRRDGFVVLR